MNMFRNRLVLLASLLALTYIVQGQNAEQRQKLNQLSQTFGQQFEHKKADAIRMATELGLPVRQELADGRVIELMRFENGFPIYYTTHNAEGAEVINSDKVYPGGAAGLSLTGSGQTLGMWDGGRTRIEHQEFGGRVTQQDGASTNSNHATHVAGTIMAGGVEADAKGMSYAANLDAYDWNNDEGEMAAAAAVGLRVSQHSYGLITGWAYGNWSGNEDWHWFGNTTISQTEDYEWGFYSAQAEDWDQIASNAPNYLMVKSAGNDRGEGPASGSFHYVYDNGSNSWIGSTTSRDSDGGTNGYDCISHAGTAKNIMTVGAVTSVGDMSSFSGWGPTDDGRVKPDIVAKGVGVFSPVASTNSSYDTYQGTSMSGPMITGSVGLLLEHQENLHPGQALTAAAMKALILHSADDMVSGSPGPDYRFGWGMMDTEKAASIMSDNASNDLHIHELALNNGGETEIDIQATGTEPLRATIVWTDAPGTPLAPALNPTTAMLINDLDLRIADESSTVHQPYILNPSDPSAAATTGDNFRDNVEMIHIENPVAGEVYTITINHKGTLDGGSQDFALIITGNEAIGTVADGGFETFDNSNATGSYTNNSFVGNDGISWSYIQSRDGNNDANGSGIDLPALMLRRVADNSAVFSEPISGGIGNFSVKLYKGFTGGGDRQVELFINGVSQGLSVPFDDFNEHIFEVNNINIAGDIIINIVNTTSRQVIVDDISWTSFASGGPTPPSIANIQQTPDADITSATSVSVAADVTAGDAALDVVELQWGTATGVYPNTITMSLDAGDTFVTDTDIPAQADGTTVYYVVYAEDVDNESATSGEQTYTVNDPATTSLPYAEAFDTDLGDAYTYSVSGDTKEWIAAAGVAQMNGFNSGELEEDWLILPGMNLDDYGDVTMNFESWRRFGTSDDDNYLKLLYSTNYAGVGNPTAAVWTELSFEAPAAEQVWTPSGNIDLSAIVGTSVWIAFKYHYNAGSYVRWEIDNIEIIEEVPAVPPSITNIVQTPDSDINSTTTVSVAADVTQGDAAISTVELQWGTTTEVYPNNITMSLNAGTYITDSDIPAQADGTTVYYVVYAEDTDNESATSAEQSYNVVDVVAGGGLETFDNSNATTSYADNSFVGDNGITWSYVHSRDANNDANGSGIDLPALMLRRVSNNSSVTSESITGGIGNFSVKLYKGFTGAGNRQVELLINGESKGLSIPFDDFNEHVFEVQNINIPGDIVISILNVTTTQIIVDDISWTGFDGVVVNPPVIANIVQTPNADITSTTSVAVSADVTAGDAALDAVELQWGTEEGVYPNIIAMSLDAGDTYVTNADIPAQADGTSVYYVVFAEDVDGETATSAEQYYSVNDPATTSLPYAETFDTGLGDAYTYSVSGDTKEWIAAAGVAQMNGFNSGELEEDWLILPGMNLDDYGDVTMNFESWRRFGTSDDDNYLKLLYSTNYAGVGNPTAAVWTELSFDAPAEEQVWTPSGNIDLSAIAGTSVWIAFKYHYNAGSYVRWEIDNIEIIEEVPAVPPSITNIVQTPDSDINSTTTVSVAAVVTAGDAALDVVDLKWGTATGVYPNTITMSLDAGDTFVTDTDIPAQVDGTTVYYVVYAEDVDNESATSAEQSYNVVDVVAGGGLETFDNSNATTSYADNSFVGDNGITWSYVHSRDANNDANGSGIDLPALMLRRVSNNSSVTSEPISGGIGNFSVKLYKGFTGAGNRQVELLINGESKGLSIPFDDFNEHVFEVQNINIPGDIVISILNVTTTQIIVDDISWTGFDGVVVNPPVIANIIQTPDADITSTTSVAVSADVTAGDAAIDIVELQWNTTNDFGTFTTIAMAINAGDTYTTAADIPAQADGTTVFYRIYAEDMDAESTTSAVQNYTVNDPATTTLPYAETFDTDLGDTYTYSVSGDTKEWIASNGAAQMNGFNSGDLEEDWLILPGINLDDYGDVIMTFETWRNFGSDDVDNYLKLFYSTDYAGVGNPSSASWTELIFAKPDGGNTQVWTPSGNVDLSTINGTSVWIAFKYHYNAGNYVRWEIDNIAIEEVPEILPPSIANIVQTPDSNIDSETTVSVSADVTEGDAAISLAELQWGTATGDYPNTIAMSLDAGNTYVTDTDIPAQADGTTVYYMVYAEDVDGESASSEEQNYLVEDVDPTEPYVVDFEGDGETKTAYSSGAVTLSGLEWNMTEALIGTSNSDFKNGIRSARLRGYGNSAISMLENKPLGIGSISFHYRRYGSDAQVDWMVEYSTNNGADWTQVGSDFTAPETDDVQNFNESVNVTGNVRIRIKRATEEGNANRRLNIDDIVITNFTGGPVPPSIFNIVQFPATNISPTTLVDVEANVTAGDAPIAAVELRWGTTNGNYPNTIAMSVVEDNTYGTDESIPAQASGTTVYYVIVAEDEDGETATSSVRSYTVITLDPALVLDPEALSGFNYTLGEGPSAAQTYEVSGYNLIGSGLIDVTAPDSYEISVDDINWANQLVLQFQDGELIAQPRTIYVRLIAGLEEGEYDEVITHNHSSIDPVDLPVSGSVTTLNQVANIAELRNGQTDGTIYQLAGEAILTFQTNTRNQKYIQDATGAILIDDNAGNITTAYELYDGITGITGTLSVFQNMIQFVPSADPGPASSTGNTISPEIITLNELNASYQAQLVTVNMVEFTNPSGNFTVSTNYPITDPSGSGVFRTQYAGLDYIGTPVPALAQNITGVILQYQSTMQLIARSLDDFETASIEDPFIVVNPNTLNGLSYLVGEGPSAVQSFNISGTNLNSSITITPPQDYEISTETGGSFNPENPIVLAAVDGNVASTPIYVRLKAGLPIGQYNNQQILTASQDANNPTVTVNGSVSDPDAGGGLETFANLELTGSSYQDGTFLGQDGSTWTFFQARGDVEIDGKAIMLGRNRDPQANVFSGSINGGVGIINFDYMQAFSTNVNLNVLVNDIVVGNVTSDGEQNIVKNSGDFPVNISGPVVIKFINENNSDGQVVIDNVSWTGFNDGTQTVAMPTFNPPSGNYTDPINVSISTSTTGATLFYSETSSSGPWTLYTGPVAVDEATTLWAYGEKEDYQNSPVASATYSFSEYTQVATIAELRNGLTNGTIYELTGEAILTFQSSTRNQKYIQDATAAILIDDAPGVITTDYELYDGITGIAGTLTTFSNMLQFTPVEDPGAASSNGNTIAPVVVSLDQLNVTHQAKLVQVNMVDFINASGVFVTSTNYPIEDPTEEGVFRTQYGDVDYIGTTVPTVTQNITGVILQFSSTLQLIARSLDDFETANLTDPWITVNPNTLSGFSYEVGEGPSAEQSFTISGINLTGNITVTPPQDYEISTETGDDFVATDPIVLAQTGGNVSATPIFVRLKAGLPIGQYNNQQILTASADANNPVVTLNGTVIDPDAGGGFETFANLELTGSSYQDGTFLGQDGSTWTFYQARGDIQIDEESITLGRNRDPQSNVFSGTINGGIGIINFDYMQAFSTNVNLNVLVNDVVVGNVTSDGEQEIVKNSGDITVNIPGPIVIKFINVNNSDGQVTIDNIAWTGFDDGTQVVAMPTFNPPAGNYTEPISVSISTTTPDATLFYSETSSTGPWTLYTAPIDVDENTTLWAYGEKEDYQNSAVASATYTFSEIVQVADIAALRNGQTNGTVYQLTGEAILTFQTSTRNQKYIQDETAAILIDDNPGVITTTYDLYDGITGITGTLTTFQNMLQFVPVEDPGAASSVGNTLEPVLVALDQLDETYQAQLVTIQFVSFDETGIFEPSTSYDISDPTDVGVFRTQYADVDYIGTTIPEEAMHITGVILQYQTNMQLVARSLADFGEISTDPLIIANPNILNGLVYNVGEGPSASQSYALTAQNLEGSGNINLTAPEHFEISSDDVTFTDNIQIAYADGQIVDQPVTIWARLKADLPLGLYEDENIEHSGGGAPDMNVTLNGGVFVAATQLAFVNVPEGGIVNQPISPFTVEAQDDDGNLSQGFNGIITLTKQSGPGDVNGTLEVEAVNGIALFDDISFDTEGVYTLLATAEGLTEAISEMIEIVNMPDGMIAFWDFNEESLDPTIGEGTAGNVGGTSSSWAAGLTGNPDRGWNTASYPEQATASGTAGVEFFVSTIGYENIQLQFFQRGSGTASRYATLQYTLDGTNWTDYETYLTGPPHDTFYEYNFDFSDMSGANDNANFGVRLLAIFSPEPFTDGAEPFTEWGADEAYRAVRDDRNYSPQGTWRFDNVGFSGDVIIGLPETRMDVHIYTTWNQFVIQTNDKSEVQMHIFNLMGQPVMQRELHGQNVYRFTHNLPPAAYIVRIAGQQGIITKKVMVY